MFVHPMQMALAHAHSSALTQPRRGGQKDDYYSHFTHKETEARRTREMIYSRLLSLMSPRIRGPGIEADGTRTLLSGSHSDRWAESREVTWMEENLAVEMSLCYGAARQGGPALQESGG